MRPARFILPHLIKKHIISDAISDIATFLLPSPQILLAIHWAACLGMRKAVLPHINPPCDEWCQLCPVLAWRLCDTVGNSTYIEVRQIWTDIRPHFLPINQIPAVLCMRTHGARAVAFVVIVWALLGGQSQALDGAL
jgi:hypothetical protein